MSKSRSAVMLAAAMLITSQAALAEEEEEMHSDVEFGYVDGQIEVEFSPEGRVFEGDFDTTPGVDFGTTNEPGFASEAPEFGNLTDGDAIVYNVLGSLRFWDGTSEAPVGATTQITLTNIGPVPATVLTGTSGVQPGTFSGGAPFNNSIGIAGTGLDFDGEPAGPGEIHGDLGWLLEDTTGAEPATGAYAVLISLSTSNPGIEDSVPFFIVQNFGLGEEAFEAGVEFFASTIPEPTSFALFGAAVGMIGVSRRRREE